MIILVADDSAAMRAIVKRALSRLERVAGARVVEAHDGAGVLAAVRAEAPELILCDWHMPGMSGLEVLETLRADGVSAPFGFITAEASEAMHEVARAAGAQFLIVKPFLPETLDRALEGALP